MPPTIPSTSPSASGNKSLKFRLSCDRCQSDKVRCSRDKPSCKRCERRQLGCVYSPFRHVGRPRRVVSATTRPEEQNAEDADDDSSDSVVRTSSGLTPDDSHGHSASTVATSVDGSCVYGTDSNKVALPRNHLHVLTPSPSQSLGLTVQALGGNEQLPSALDVWVHNHQFPFHTPPDSRYNSTPKDSGASPGHVNYPLTSQSRLTPNSSDELSCYTTILRQTAKLEEELLRTSKTPPIDLVFEAVGDFSSLQHCVFECSGHHHTHPSLAITAIHTSSCLLSDQPVVLGLAILADRVVGMLEGLVRIAAQSAQTTDRANDVLWTTAPTHEPDIQARRAQRSFRTNWVKGCVSLETEADRNLCISTFVVQGQAKSAAMKRILKLRVRRMLGALESLQAMGRTRQVSNDQRDQFSAGPLDWGGSGAVLMDLADTLLRDLRRRMESVRGAVVLF